MFASRIRIAVFVFAALVVSQRASAQECWQITEVSCWNHLAQAIPCILPCPELCCAQPLAIMPTTAKAVGGSPGKTAKEPNLLESSCCGYPAVNCDDDECVWDRELRVCLNCWFDTLKGANC